MFLSRSTKENLTVYFKDLEEDLKCVKCGKVAVEPHIFFNCQHFFCKPCINFRDINCSVCGIPSYIKDIKPYRFLNNVIQYSMSLKSLLLEDSEFKNIYEDGSNQEKSIEKDTTSNLVEKCSIASGSKEDGSNGEKGIEKDTTSNQMEKRSKASGSKEYTSTKNERDSNKGENNSKPNESIGKRSKVCEMFTTPTKRVKSSSFEDSYKKSTTPPARKSVNKRNMKGETPLHIACIKGNVNQLMSLIENGANPNVKDNFGWTPLYEAVNHKNLSIVKILLELAGAWVNTPGGENMTPLHNAAYCNWIEGAKLLLEFGANPKLTDIYGRKPIDYSPSDTISNIMKEALNRQHMMINPIAIDIYELEDQVVFLGDELSNEDQKLLANLSALIPGSKITNKFTSEVSHVIVNAEKGICSSSSNVLMGIISGKVIASVDWVAFSVKMKNVVHSYTLGVRSTKDYPNYNGIIRSRLSSKILLPNLFSGLHFSFPSVFRVISYKLLRKDNLIQLIIQGGGRYLSREPDPEAIPATEKTVPFYANNSISDILGRTEFNTSPKSDYNSAMLNKRLGVDWKSILYDLDENHPLKNCSHIILYPVENGKALLEKSFIRYNMKHLKSLPIDWFIGCIESYTLLDPTPFI